MRSLRRMLLEGSDIDPSLRLPPGHCFVGPNDPPDCHPEENIVHNILAGGSSGSSIRKSPPIGEINGGLHRPDNDEGAPKSQQEYSGGDAGLGVPDMPTPTLRTW